MVGHISKGVGPFKEGQAPRRDESRRMIEKPESISLGVETVFQGIYVHSHQIDQVSPH